MLACTKTLTNADGDSDVTTIAPLILRIVKLKTNSIAEINTLKHCIPKVWLNIIKTKASVKTKVKTKLDLNIFDKPLTRYSNKHVYTSLNK